MSNKSNGNGTNRDIESILADIRVQAQRRQRLAHTINPGLAQGVTGGMEPHVAMSGLAYAYQQQGAAAQPGQPDLPVILLKSGVTPKVGHPAPTPARRDEGGRENASARPLSSALETLRNNIEQDGTSQAPNGGDSIEARNNSSDALQNRSSINGPAVDGAEQVQAHERLSTLKSTQNENPIQPEVAPETTSKTHSADASSTIPQQKTAAVQSDVSGDATDLSAKPRTMASFMDTRMSRMVGPDDVEIRQDVTTTPAQSTQVETAVVAPAAEPTQSNATTVMNAPATNHADENVDDVHDVAAELLRPMLKDWVGENMPQIVQKALELENKGGGKNDEDS